MDGGIMNTRIIVIGAVLLLASACGKDDKGDGSGSGGGDQPSCAEVAEHAVELLLASGAPPEVLDRTSSNKKGAIENGKKGCEKLDPPAETRKCFLAAKDMGAYSRCGQELDKQYEREISCRMLAEKAIDLTVADKTTAPEVKESLQTNREHAVKNGMTACQTNGLTGEKRRCVMVATNLAEYQDCVK
jgi:hypothetical protein